jgi:hypothetical protein|tara:strand:- start:3614 stop:4000 length:387 start_codon:yes stop_codon:yes gene_type:complete
MAAPTADEVKEIKPTTLTDAQIDTRVVSAGVLTGDLNAKCDTTFTTGELEGIQLWLAAHLVAITTPDAKRESMLQNDLDITHHRGELGMGILSTEYGQMANMLAHGCLVDFMSQKPQILFVGSETITA